MSATTDTPAEEGAARRWGLLERPTTRRLDPFSTGHRRWGRPELHTAYRQDMALLNTRPKLVGVLAIVVGATLVPFNVTDATLVVLASALAACIGAIGLNLVTGYAGQVSLGHAFFLGLGAFTAAVMSGDPEGRLHGFGITWMPLWLLGAGLMAALVGLIVSPLAVRLKGLYLAIVTLGLVLLGEHIFKEADTFTGGPGIGRSAAIPDLFGLRLNRPHEVFGYQLTRAQQLYLMMLVMLIVFAVIGRNLARSAVGRAFSAVRDRDIAAEIIGVNLFKQKALAFTISSFYAGVAGALLYTVSGFVEPGSFNLLLSVQYIAMILIGGVATISGAIMGGLFISTLSYVVRQVSDDVPIFRLFTSAGLDTFQVEAILFGLLIIGFLILEPRGLFGIWIRIRNYGKAWPFSY